jgi:hypothetical protein
MNERIKGLFLSAFLELVTALTESDRKEGKIRGRIGGGGRLTDSSEINTDEASDCRKSTPFRQKLTTESQHIPSKVNN